MDAKVKRKLLADDNQGVDIQMLFCAVSLATAIVLALGTFLWLAIIKFPAVGFWLSVVAGFSILVKVIYDYIMRDIYGDF